jgi:hypothetical protein
VHVLQVYQRAGDQFETVIVAARNWHCRAIGSPCEIQSAPFALRAASRDFDGFLCAGAYSGVTGMT